VRGTWLWLPHCSAPTCSSMKSTTFASLSMKHAASRYGCGSTTSTASPPVEYYAWKSQWRQARRSCTSLSWASSTMRRCGQAPFVCFDTPSSCISTACTTTRSRQTPAPTATAAFTATSAASRQALLVAGRSPSGPTDGTWDTRQTPSRLRHLVPQFTHACASRAPVMETAVLVVLEPGERLEELHSMGTHRGALAGAGKILLVARRGRSTAGKRRVREGGFTWMRRTLEPCWWSRVSVLVLRSHWWSMLLLRGRPKQQVPPCRPRWGGWIDRLFVKVRRCHLLLSLSLLTSCSTTPMQWFRRHGMRSQDHVG
jgi:hypothetical protein